MTLCVLCYVSQSYILARYERPIYMLLNNTDSQLEYVSFPMKVKREFSDGANMIVCVKNPL